MAQGDQRYMLSVGESVGHRIVLEPTERENRFIGQLGFSF